VQGTMALIVTLLGAVIGAVSLSGSLIAWAKLDGRMDKRFTFAGQQAVNFLVLAAAAVYGYVGLAKRVDRPSRGRVALFVLGALLIAVSLNSPRMVARQRARTSSSCERSL